MTGVPRGPDPHGASFALYVVAFVAFDVASQVQSVATAWQVYSVRHSAFDLGLVGLVIFLPSLLLAPLTGIVADRVDRRAIVAVSALAEIAICAALTVLAPRHGAGALALILAVLFAAGCARAFAFPAEHVLLAAVVPQATYMRASALSGALRQFVRIGGPALGGLLVALGALPAYAAASVLFAAGALGIAGVRLLTRPANEDAPSFRDALAGLRYIIERPVIGGAISLDLFAVLFGSATALLPVYATEIFHTGAVGFGVLRASSVLGTALCALVIARRPIHRYAGPRLLAAVACFGGATVAFGLSTSLWIAMPALALVGASDMISMAIRDALVNLRTPDAMRGRVGAVEGVFISASNELGEFESGTLAALIGAVPTVVAGGLATMAVVGLWTWRNRELRTADHVVTTIVA